MLLFSIYRSSSLHATQDLPDSSHRVISSSSVGRISRNLNEKDFTKNQNLEEAFASTANGSQEATMQVVDSNGEHVPQFTENERKKLDEQLRNVCFYFYF